MGHIIVISFTKITEGLHYTCCTQKLIVQTKTCFIICPWLANPNDSRKHKTAVIWDLIVAILFGFLLHSCISLYQLYFCIDRPFCNNIEYSTSLIIRHYFLHTNAIHYVHCTYTCSFYPNKTIILTRESKVAHQKQGHILIHDFCFPRYWKPF